jgi:hypothetical protein
VPAEQGRELEGQALRERLRQLMLGYQISQCIHVAAKLGIADLLEDGPRSSQELAAATQTQASALVRFLRVLGSQEMLSVDGEGRYCSTPMLRLLCDRAPGSLRAAGIYWGEAWMWDAWGQLLYSLQTGSPAFDHVHGASLFEFLARAPEAGEVFDRFIRDGLHARPKIVAASFDFSRAKVIVDVGGGQGMLLAEILAANPAARGVLFDRPHVLKGACGRLAEVGMLDRCRTIEGDFFEWVPEGGDTYLLSQIIHDWHDDQAVTILANCRRAMDARSRIIIVEQILDETAPRPITTLLDLTMLTIVGGKERTEAEYRALLAASGFALSEIVSTPSPFSIIEAVLDEWCADGAHQ